MTPDKEHYGYKPYPDNLASKSAWIKKGRKVKAGETAFATATRRPKGVERASRRYDLFHIEQTTEVKNATRQDA